MAALAPTSLRAGPVRAALVIAAALTALGALAAAGTSIWHDRARAELATARTQAGEAQNRVSRANEELADIQATLPRYRALGNLVASAAEGERVAQAARLGWIERVTTVRDTGNLNNFRYTLEPRIAVAGEASADPNAPADPNAGSAPVQLYATRMDLEFTTLHEGEWMRALRQMGVPPTGNATSLMHWKECTLERSGMQLPPISADRVALPAELSGRCKIDWLTVQERAPLPEGQPPAPAK
jgi:hypothetical protein